MVEKWAYGPLTYELPLGVGRLIGYLPRLSQEHAVLDDRREGIPLGRIEDQSRAGRILRIAHANHAAFEVGHLNTCGLAVAAAALEPLGGGQVSVHVSYLLVAT
jgi:hypothetical protein